VIVIEEVVFADRAHMGADSLPDFAIELTQGDAFPLGGRLNDLGIETMTIVVVVDVELDRSP